MVKGPSLSSDRCQLDRVFRAATFLPNRRIPEGGEVPIDFFHVVCQGDFELGEQDGENDLC